MHDWIERFSFGLTSHPKFKNEICVIGVICGPYLASLRELCVSVVKLWFLFVSIRVHSRLL